MNNENYIVIQGWMRNELKLKGNELMTYALIYGFSQDEDDQFTGSVAYIADWIGSTKQTVYTVLKSLVDKGMLEKEETHNNGVKFCRYKTLPVVKKFDEGVVKNFDGGSQKILPNNIDDITKDNIKKRYNTDIYKDIVLDYNSICNRLVKAEKLTSKRKTHIKARLAELSREELTIAFHKANESDFLCGVNNRGWKADFDWLIKNDENITKVLEGKYDNKDQMGETEMELQKAYDAIRGDDNDHRTFDFE